MELIESDGSTKINATSGIVQYCYQGRKHVICDSFWSFSNARVACRSLGYSPYGN